MSVVDDPQRIMIIEDDPNVSSAVARALQREGFEVITTPSGLNGLRRFEQENPDLIILDLMLPDVNGMEVCREVLRIRNVPIVMLTARAQEEDRVTGLEIGATDYVTKPFSLRELTARVKRILYRVAKTTVPTRDEIVVGDIRLNIPAHTLFVGDREVHLTRTEFRIMRILMENAGRVVTRAQLSEAIWGEEIQDRHLLEAHISNLRRKIEKDPHHPEHLKTVRGFGYKLI